MWEEFLRIKEQIDNSTRLTLPDIHQDFIIYCDVLRQDLGVFSCKEERL
jgi:hypothetical protein